MYTLIKKNYSVTWINMTIIINIRGGGQSILAPNVPYLNNFSWINWILDKLIEWGCCEPELNPCWGPIIT